MARRDAGLPVDVVELATHVRCCAEAGDARAASILVDAGDAVVGATPRSAVEWYRDALALLPLAGTQSGEAEPAARAGPRPGVAARRRRRRGGGRDGHLAGGATTGRRRRRCGCGRSPCPDRPSAAAQLFEELADLPALRRPRILAQRALLLDSLDRIPEAAAVIAEAEAVADGGSRMWVEIPRLHLAMSIGDWATGRRVADALAVGPPVATAARPGVDGDLPRQRALEQRRSHDRRSTSPPRSRTRPLWTSMAAGPIARALARVGRWDDGLTVAADAVAQDGDRGLLYLAWLTIAFVAAERAEPPLDVEVVRAGLSAIELYPTTALLCLAYLDVAEGRDERGPRPPRRGRGPG